MSEDDWGLALPAFKPDEALQRLARDLRGLGLQEPAFRTPAPDFWYPVVRFSVERRPPQTWVPLVLQV